MSFDQKIIIALDMQKKEDLDQFLSQVKNEVKYLKVGMELFYTFGPEVVLKLKKMGFKVFIDLKVHDIPNTAFHSVKTLTSLGVDMINLHALGGKEMLRAGYLGMEEALDQNPNLKRPKLIGVTILTSMQEKDLKEMGSDLSLKDMILKLSKVVKEAGLDGVVCSAHEVPFIKKEMGKDFLTVTPGIRLKSDSIHDQQRVMSPKEAFSNGSDYIVIGRSVTQANKPHEKFQTILKDLL